MQIVQERNKSLREVEEARDSNFASYSFVIRDVVF